MRITPEYLRKRAVGGDVATVVGPFTVRGEAAYIHLDHPAAEPDYFQYVLGSRTDFRGHDGQRAARSSWSSGSRRSCPSDFVAAPLDFNYLFQKSTTVRVQRNLTAAAQVVVEGLYEWASRGYYVQPAASYRFGDHVRVEGFVDLLGGRPAQFFGYLRREQACSVPGALQLLDSFRRGLSGPVMLYPIAREPPILASSVPGKLRERPMTIVDVFLKHATERADRTAYVFLRDDGQEETLTFGQLARRARAIAAELQAHGLRRRPRHPVVPARPRLRRGHPGVLLRARGGRPGIAAAQRARSAAADGHSSGRRRPPGADQQRHPERPGRSAREPRHRPAARPGCAPTAWPTSRADAFDGQLPDGFLAGLSPVHVRVDGQSRRA